MSTQMRILEDENEEDINNSSCNEILLETVVNVEEDKSSVNSVSSVGGYLWNWQVLESRKALLHCLSI